MQSKPIVVCDFDGTITQVDVTDLVLSQFAHPSWRDVEQEWMRGSIGSRECLERQMALVDVSAEELEALADSVPVDPHFLKFYRSLQKRSVPFHVVTDGFDIIVRRVLRRAGLNGGLRNGTHIFASALRVEDRSLRTAFPYSTLSCPHGCATCKARIIRQLRRDGRSVVFIGDGLSDRFAVEVADQVFAKRPLAAYCREKGINFRPFETFREIESALGDSVVAAPQKGRRALAPMSP